MGENSLNNFFNRFRHSPQTQESISQLMPKYRGIKSIASGERNRNQGKLSNTTEERISEIELRMIATVSSPIERDVLTFVSKNKFDLEPFFEAQEKGDLTNPIKHNIERVINSINRGFDQMHLPQIGKETLLWAIDSTKENSNDIANIYNQMSLSIIQDRQFYGKPLEYFQLDKIENPKEIVVWGMFRLIAIENLPTLKILTSTASVSKDHSDWVKNLINQTYPQNYQPPDTCQQ